MPVICQLCQQEFPSLITGTHLKSHQTSAVEYKSKFGNNSLASPEYREKRSQQSAGINNPNYGNKMSTASKKIISEKKRGTVPWNKGMEIQDTTIYKEAAAKREQRYQAGELERKSHEYTQETRDKISEALQAYAMSNPEELKKRAKKSLATKQQRGQDLAFFRGKKHTPEAKAQISLSAKQTNQQKTQQSFEKASRNAELANCVIINYDQQSLVLQCSTCGYEFTRTRQYLVASAKYRADLCEVCYPRNYQNSIVETQIADFIKSFGHRIIQNDRTLLSGKKEIDIYIPERNIGIEVNGIYWHSNRVLEDNGYSPKKDFEKYQTAVKSGIKLLTIYDAEWYNKTEIVKSRIAGMLGENKKVGARNCAVVELTSKQANLFLKQNHIQGSGRSNARYGLMYNDKLISVMTFSKENVSRKLRCWEINRFCHKLGNNVVGGASKLFTHFLRTHHPEQVISYSDNRWGDGNVYQYLGMEQVSHTPPNYWYFRPNEYIMHHRYALRKNKHDNQNLTEWQNRKEQGWNRIWDCGSTKWVFQQNLASTN